MLVIGLTGGIGSGKSTVAAMLVAHGAVLIDTDELARVVVQPGEAAHDAVAKRFGEELLDHEGRIDRGALAAIVFSDAAARADLEAIVHPAVGQLVRLRLDEESTSDHVVILEVPLLINADGMSRYEADGILVVDTPHDMVIERLVTFRDMDQFDAESRIAAQVPREVRIRAADFVIMNIGTLSELEQMTENAWRWIEQLDGEQRTATAD